jgi:putative redox protein
MAEQTEPAVRADMVWQGGMRFAGGRPGGPTLLVDGERQAAPSPVEALVVSIASCSAIDVVEILTKRRTPPTSLRVEVEYTRAPSPPRRLTDVKLRYIVATRSERHHVERAVALSFETYCSVSRSLDPALPLSWEVELLPVGEAVTAP